ncbi:tryptophan-rich sensory protein [bacterium]|nr:tryptophan-rich sensory protein [bacterium]NBX50223.1 tryptophan-rich sensory protein [bacterium]
MREPLHSFGKNTPHEWLALFLWIMTCQLAGIIGSAFSLSAIPTWYETLTKPFLTPPGWVFGPVWTTLYVLMGCAAFFIWKKARKTSRGKIALVIFGLQLALNTLWSILFFGAQNIAAALAEIVILWMAIATTIILFWRISKTAAWLLVPYLLWVSFATYLTYAFWTLN